MRVPLSWLAEYVDLAPDSTPEDVHAALVSVGLEEEDVHRFEVSGPVVVGEVLEFTEEPQKNGKVIRWCRVRVAPEGAAAADGGEDVRGIVCGAHNFAPGDRVVVTLPGSVLPGPFPIAARKTYGHVSDGMIASARELGLGEDHDGILRLAALGIDAEPGTDAVALLGLDDSAVEINVTPDRGYAFSIRGVAREYSHATGAAFRDPAAASQAHESAEGVTVTIDDRAPIRGNVGSRVFVTRVVRDVDPSRPTPPWMVSRLVLAGIRSRSLIVDVTNYVMLELGQPIHAYDLDTVSGDITVRRALPDEHLVTLDGEDRALDAEDLVIADASGAIGLAGVMGGARTEIGPGTRNVLVEAANFDAVSIARTARRHKLPSEASKRFERGVDPRVARAAAARVVGLLEDLAGGRADGSGSDLESWDAPAPIELPAGYVSRLIGVDYTPEELRGALAEIGGRIEETATGLAVTPPSWRPDLAAPCDLAEEVARIVGYDRIPSVLPVAPPGRGLTTAQRLRRAASQAWAASGLVEVLSYPFVSAAENARFGSPAGTEIPAVKLANPIDARTAYLRTSLLPGLIGTARRNLSRGFTDLALYETGLVFRPEPGVRYGSAELPAGAALPAPEVLAQLNAGIPPQPRHIAALFLGAAVERGPGQAALPAGIADALDAVCGLAAALGLDVRITTGAHGALHPGRTAEITTGEGEDAVHLGYAGELLPALTEEFDLPRVVAVVELDLDRMIAAAPGHVVARGISVYPAATQDLSLVVAEGVSAATVHEALVEGCGELLEHARLVEDYRGPAVDPGSKSLTFALRFRAADRTLTAAEAGDAKLAGAALAAERCGARVRE